MGTYKLDIRSIDSIDVIKPLFGCQKQHHSPHFPRNCPRPFWRCRACMNRICIVCDLVNFSLCFFPLEEETVKKSVPYQTKQETTKNNTHNLSRCQGGPIALKISYFSSCEEILFQVLVVLFDLQSTGINVSKYYFVVSLVRKLSFAICYSKGEGSDECYK